MATQTARDLITASLKRLGVISGIETPAADLAVDALARLNDLIETWATESLTLWSQNVVVSPLLPVSASLYAYTIGPTGAIPVPTRPPWMEQVAFVLSTDPFVEFPLTPLDREHWIDQEMKFLRSPQATHYRYEPDWPLGYILLHPLPSVAFTLILRFPRVLQLPATLDTVFSFPPGYMRALRDYLAIELAPEVGRPVDPALAQSAIEAKAQLQRVNFQPRTLSMPPGIATADYGGYDWRVE